MKYKYHNDSRKSVVHMVYDKFRDNFGEKPARELGRALQLKENTINQWITRWNNNTDRQ